MDVILFNLDWMSFNIFLAAIPVVFGFLLANARLTLLKITYGIIWFIFLPNTIYLLTDITHFFDYWYTLTLLYKSIYLAQFSILMLLGVISFVVGMYPVEKFIQERRGVKKRKKAEIILYATNFFVGFGLVLGRIERINSWDIIFNSSRVLYQSIHTITSAYLLLLAIFFGLFSNLIYFSLREILLKNRRD